MTQLNVSGQSYEFLVNARGDLYHLRRYPEAWYCAFRTDLQNTVHQIGFAPTHMLDIGSSLGAIDILMTKVYGTKCTLIDGENGDGYPKKHAEPFCGRFAVERFWRENGIPPEDFSYCSPDNLHGPIFDFVISTRSWCFHYPPEQYLGFVQSHTCAGSRLLIDVRHGKPQWREVLQAAFREVDIIQSEPKFDRIMYQVRGRMQ